MGVYWFKSCSMEDLILHLVKAGVIDEEGYVHHGFDLDLPRRVIGPLSQEQIEVLLPVTI